MLEEEDGSLVEHLPVGGEPLWMFWGDGFDEPGDGGLGFLSVEQGGEAAF